MSFALQNKQNSSNDIISNAQNYNTDIENKEAKQLSLDLQPTNTMSTFEKDILVNVLTLSTIENVY